MPEVRCERNVAGTLAEVWPFVADVDRWALLMTGYVSHECPTEEAA